MTADERHLLTVAVLGGCPAQLFVSDCPLQCETKSWGRVAARKCSHLLEHYYDVDVYGDDDDDGDDDGDDEDSDDNGDDDDYHSS